jgi:hypothetical protein
MDQKHDWCCVVDGVVEDLLFLLISWNQTYVFGQRNVQKHNSMFFFNQGSGLIELFLSL